MVTEARSPCLSRYLWIGKTSADAISAGHAFAVVPDESVLDTWVHLSPREPRKIVRLKNDKEYTTSKSLFCQLGCEDNLSGGSLFAVAFK